MSSPDDPIAFLFTWSTYGTWLPGDSRGWVEYRHGFQLPDPILELECKARMTEDACRLAQQQRERVHQQVAETCAHKRWILHAVNCRTNHVHVVLSSATPPKTIREQLKAWCTRRLNEQQEVLNIPEQERRTKWWADRGSIRWIFLESDLAAAVDYVLIEQDNPRRFMK
jgi:REP element-mobilizing transposase RayT